MSFNFRKLNIPDVALIETDTPKDERGFFAEIYKRSEFSLFHLYKDFVQINQSKSKKDVLRGLHYQLNPKAQDKLVLVVEGEIFDVAVDIRKDSPYYGKWVAEVLSSKNKKALYIPEGFAHGFCVLSNVARVVYCCTDEYSSEHDRGILWNDLQLQINWPIKNPILSEKDSKLPPLEKAENNFTYNEG